jgi:hypothetical protein
MMDCCELYGSIRRKKDVGREERGNWDVVDYIKETRS